MDVRILKILQIYKTKFTFMPKSVPSLTDIARGFKSSKKTDTYPITDEHKDLARAWANGDVNLKQVTHALKLKSEAGVYPYMMQIFKRIVNEG